MSEATTNSSSVQMSEVAEYIGYLKEAYDNEEWRSKQDEKVVKGVGVALDMVGFFSSEVTQFLNSFFNYVREVSSSPIVQLADSDVSTAPTQTSAPEGTRKERRARVKKDVTYTGGQGIDNA